MKVGIIGAGRFGNLLVKILIEHSDNQILVFSRNKKIDNHEFFSLEDVCNCDIIIPCVPISVFEETIKQIKDLINKKALVVDICSIKIHTVKVMLDNLPESIEILATHPMFGPDSTNNGKIFKDLKFIFSKIRNSGKKSEDFLTLWKDLDCTMIELSPAEHDRQAAFTHAFAFLVGKIGIMMNVRHNAISTKGFDCLMYNQTAVENDSSQLFEDMMKFNPFVKEMEGKFREAVKKSLHFPLITN